jgi:hypothetical protein
LVRELDRLLRVEFRGERMMRHDRHGGACEKQTKPHDPDGQFHSHGLLQLEL